MMNKELVLSLMQQGHVTDILKKNENELIKIISLSIGWSVFSFFLGLPVLDKIANQSFGC